MDRDRGEIFTDRATRKSLGEMLIEENLITADSPLENALSP